MITGRLLAKLIHDEFARDGWGDVDPSWFELASLSPVAFEQMVEEAGNATDGIESAVVLRDLLDRVAQRLNEGKTE